MIPVRFYDDHPSPPSLEVEACRGLAARPRSLSPKFFYDRRGSELFDAICRLPEYYLTRTESRILRERAREIADLAGRDVVLVELGSGASEKVRCLLDALKPQGYLAIDICMDFLREATEKLARDYPWLPVHAACADFSRALRLPYPLPEQRRLVFFPGSSIGNFNPDEARRFLTDLRPLVGEGGGFVVGVDLKKNARRLDRAYNDSQGVTAQFNRNLLERLREELGAELDVDGFAHEAIYNEALGRVEMYLVSVRSQSIQLRGRRYRFEAGERLHTENSYKYTIADFQALAHASGYESEAVWTDGDADFSVHFLRRG